MSLDTQRRGGRRIGAGRPKKKARDLQKTHSIRATDKDWKEIQIAARIIKMCRTTEKRPRVFVLDEEENARVNKYLVEGLIERSQNSRWGEPEEVQPVVMKQDEPTPKEIETPKTASEEEAVSLFLEYFRLNPIDAVSSIESKLEREKHIREMRRIRSEQEKKMDGIQRDMQDAMDSIDEINKAVAEMLQFPGYRRA